MHIDYNHNKLERFIPITLSELEEEVSKLPMPHKDKLKQLASLLQKHYHTSFHEELLYLKKSYQPFNPDSDTITLKKYTTTQLEEREEELFSHIVTLLERANYEQLTQKNINEAIEETSPYGVSVSVDFSEFNKLLLFFRGSAIKTEKRRSFKTLFLQKRETHTKIYRRLLLLFKQEVEGKTYIYIKLFKDIPQSDLEMLFPNIKVKIALFDKLKLLVTGGGGTVTGVMSFLGKVAVTLEPMALLSAIGGFVALLVRQVMSIFNHRTKYMAQLAKKLYFYNLNNNAGTLTHILDMAEDEESKEAFLAYAFLLKAETPITKETLDGEIEHFIQSAFHLPMNFEIDDALAKLVELQLVQHHQGKLKAVNPNEACSILSSQL
jgi:hypothetical protein